MFSNCTDKSCPGWMGAMIVGIIMYIVVTVMFMKDVLADVRVEITRDVPNEQQLVERQLIIQQFDDDETFQMWMAMKMESEGCDPYVTNINIIRNWQPQEG